MKPVFVSFNKITDFVVKNSEVRPIIQVIKYKWSRVGMVKETYYEAKVKLGPAEVNGVGETVHGAYWDLVDRIYESNFLKSALKQQL